MADIAMCQGGDCPLKEKCYRYTAPVSKHWQSYYMDIPYKDGICEYYWPAEYTKRGTSKYTKN